MAFSMGKMGQDKKPAVTAFDERYGQNGRPRAMVRDIDRWLHGLPTDALRRKREAADVLFRRLADAHMDVAVCVGGGDQ